jgi:hypothetical protein
MVPRDQFARFCVTLLSTSLIGVAGLALAAEPAQRVNEHLAAGEFGPALDQAAAVADPQQQAELLKQVATAQFQAGAPAAAQATLQRMPTRGAGQPQSPLSGGGANPQELIQLIQEIPGSLWVDQDGSGGTISVYGLLNNNTGGVKVAPNGILSRVTTKDTTGHLAALGVEVRKANLNEDMAQPSRLRLVSLSRLEQEVAQRLTDGLPIPESMAQFAGLSQVQYVFLDTRSHDIIIGGPAEAWQYNAEGQPVGVTSGRPTLQLDDFVTVLRTFARGDADFGCTINTREEGVKALQEYVQQSLARGPLSAGAGVRSFVSQLQRKLGKQDVIVWGVPNDSRVARVIVEADYRLKLIGIDKLDVGKAVPSYFDLLPLNLQKDPPAMEALRWWLTMKYDAVSHSPDRTVFEIQGASVRCLSENQMLTAEGKHLPTGKAEATNRMFAENFTSHYGDLARQSLVFADTQNVFDLALVAALIRHEKLESRADVEFGVFAQSGLYRPARYAVPHEIDSVVNHRVYNGRDIVVQVAGGVRGDLLAVVQDKDVAKESTKLTEVAPQAAAPQLPAGRWWWDAAK